MRRYSMLVALVALLLAGCGEEEADGLIGTWVLDTAPSDTGYRFTLRADGTFDQVTGTGEHTFAIKGTWKREGDVLTVETLEAGGQPLEEGTAAVETYQIEDGRIAFQQADKMSYLRRVK